MAFSKLMKTSYGEFYAKKSPKEQVYFRIESAGTHAKATLTKEQRIELAHFLLEDIND